ncbi:MAG: protein kinase [Lachnospiraceae bacterium]|nr:protein kinase [Lachnospiraceae bacterium]
MEKMSRTLPQGTVLIGQYEIVSVLGEGGFGITYMGRNKDGRTVAVKEYFPSSFAVRERGRLHIFSETKDKFDTGKRRFVKEAEVLRQFQHLDGIASVYECFEENDTAYIVMEYIEGITLKEYVDGQGVLTYNELVSLISPVMRALIQIHRHGVIHRDISPDNIIIGLDNKARLIDFGAAGLVNGNNIFNNAESGDDSIVYETHEISSKGTLENCEKEQRYDSHFGKTVILKTGYAPPEQYIEGGRLGAWTDVYGLAATLYMGITGRAPIDTVERLQRGEKQTGEELYAMLTGSSNEQPLNSYNESSGSERVLPWQAKAILTGLALAVDERYSNMEEFYEALTVAPSIEHDVTVMGSQIAEGDTELIKNHIQTNALRRRLPLVLAAVSLMLVLVLSAIVGVLIAEQREQKDEVQNGALQDMEESSSKTEGAYKASEGQSDDIERNTTNIQGNDIEENAAEGLDTRGNDSVPTSTTEQSTIHDVGDTTAGKKTGTGSANSEDTKDAARVTTQEQTTVNKQKKNIERSTAESIKIHEEDSVEHLNIE